MDSNRDINSKTTKQIDECIRLMPWCDFHIVSFENNTLIVGGGIDLTYCHTLEILFENVFFVSGFFSGWHSDCSKPVFQIPAHEHELNKTYEIEQGYQLFIFKTEDYKNDILIAANTVSFNTDTVFYDDRPNLKSNERMARFVKHKNTL